ARRCTDFTGAPRVHSERVARAMSRRTFMRRGLAAGLTPFLLGSLPQAAHAVNAGGGGISAARLAYFGFCDDLMPLLDDLWSPQIGQYLALQTMSHASLLLVHATTARFGHVGASRQDERARAIAARLCMSPPWRGSRSLRNHQPHDGGWLNLIDGGGGYQHPVVDTTVVRGLAAAYHARDELALPDATVLMIRDRIRRCAYGTFYEFPQLRLNQINWPVEIYAHAAAVLGEPHLLQHDARLQLGRFADHLTRPARGDRVPYTGPGYRFHYLPQNNASSPANVDNAEYANLVCGTIAYYEQARRAGMKPLTDRQIRRLRAWVERVLCGYWTHTGYPNWDSGLGFGRWHQTKKFPLCQEALLGIASAPRFQPAPQYGAWAKHLFDSGLSWYATQVSRHGGLPPAVSFGVATSQSILDSRLTAARMMANACRAVIFGLDAITGAAPPPLYAYDPDIGRLAITTPAYNTAIIAVNQGAFPYGGLEPARLFGPGQTVAANVGGTSDACFAIVVRNHRSGRVTHSQRGRRSANLTNPPLRLRTAPRGTARRPIAYPQHAYAGPFREIEAAGTTSGPTADIVSRHRFRAGHIESTWHIAPRAGARGEHSIRAQFPSWGTSATITAVLRDGTRHLLGNNAIAINRIAWLHIAGQDGGYVIVIRSRNPPGHARLLHPNTQPSAPNPGPTLALELLTHARLRRRTLTVRYAPAHDHAAATALAGRLGGTHA
ncbi:MAG TPA: hypothetical protein VFX49_00265, partial [Chloroflexota bacterium]|nr:hypothetical protein [Chloroflexota bacterium]